MPVYIYDIVYMPASRETVLSGDFVRIAYRSERRLLAPWRMADVKEDGSRLGKRAMGVMVILIAVSR